MFKNREHISECCHVGKKIESEISVASKRNGSLIKVEICKPVRKCSELMRNVMMEKMEESVCATQGTERNAKR